MPGKSLGQLEEHAFFILFLATLLVFFWVAVWGLTEELLTSLEQTYGIKKTSLYMGLLGSVVLLIGLFPQMLEKL